MLDHPNPSTRSLSQLLGKVNATNPAFQMAPLFCCSLKFCLKQALETTLRTTTQSSSYPPRHWKIYSGGRSTYPSGTGESDNSTIIYDNNVKRLSTRVGIYAMGYAPEVLGPLTNRLSTSIAWSSWQQH